MARAVPPLICAAAGECAALGFIELADPEPTRCRVRPARCDPDLEKDEVRLLSLISSFSTTHRILSTTLPHAGVNFKLLFTRLIMTCKMRCWSPQRHMSLSLPTPAGPMAGSLLSMLVRRSGLGLTSPGSGPIKLT